MSFFKICDVDFADENSKPLSLKVVQNDGVNTSPNMDITVTKLYRNTKGRSYNNFNNNGYGGLTFKIAVILLADEEYDRVYNNTDNYKPTYNNNALNWLDYWIRNMVPLYVATDAIDVKNGRYVITDNSTRKQTYKDYTVWELEFTTYTGLTVTKFNSNNKAINTVVKNYKNSQKKKTTAKTTKTKTASSKSTNKSKLSKCKVSQIKYSKTQKKVACVTYMQNVLYKAGYLTKKQVDGWFGPKTKNALKKWQEKYKSKYKLKVTGNMDSATLKAMCK